jgi:hypothetical protein
MNRIWWDAKDQQVTNLSPECGANFSAEILRSWWEDIYIIIHMGTDRESERERVSFCAYTLNVLKSS